MSDTPLQAWGGGRARRDEHRRAWRQDVRPFCRVVSCYLCVRSPDLGLDPSRLTVDTVAIVVKYCF